jgi:hypothetical protein
MVSDDRERLRVTFDRAADLYQDARPDYPERLFDRLVEVTGLRANDPVLEVGAGPRKGDRAAGPPRSADHRAGARTRARCAPA